MRRCEVWPSTPTPGRGSGVGCCAGARDDASADVPESILKAAKAAPDHWFGMVDPAWRGEDETEHPAENSSGSGGTSDEASGRSGNASPDAGSGSSSQEEKPTQPPSEPWPGGVQIYAHASGRCIDIATARTRRWSPSW